jgi:hypothetical protein
MAWLYAQGARDLLRSFGITKVKTPEKSYGEVKTPMDWYGVNDLGALSAVEYFRRADVAFPFNPNCYDVGTLSTALTNQLYIKADPMRTLAELEEMMGFGGPPVTAAEIVASLGEELLAELKINLLPSVCLMTPWRSSGLPTAATFTTTSRNDEHQPLGPPAQSVQFFCGKVISVVDAD